MIRVADYLLGRLAERGVEHVFVVTGGGAMHLNDALQQSPLRAVCAHHEQGAAVAAEGYARAGERLGVVMVTTGPGATNAITGVFGAFVDSVPLLVLSGQVKRETCSSSYPDLGLRQLGDQEVDIVPMVRGVTKYAVQLREPERVRYELEKALHLAESGRKGPVWLDIPVDVQGALVDPTALRGFEPEEDPRPPLESGALIRARDLLATAERPLVVAGHGVRLAGAVADLLAFVEEQELPTASTLLGFDLVPSDHPSHVGRIGTIGDRAGNFALQNADVVLFVGTRNNIRQASYAFANFARSATKIVVDIDAAELRKPTVRPEVAIHADAGEFLRELRRVSPLPSGEVRERRRTWLAWGRERRARYSPVLPEYRARSAPMSPYVVMAELSRALPPDAIVVTANATACITFFQAGSVVSGQRVIWNSGSASMGYGLPAAIGAAAATGRTVVCLEGEGSLMMNLQELETLSASGLPVHVLVLDNGGYVSIRQTQTNFFQGRLIGTGPTSGVTFPATEDLARTFRLPYRGFEAHEELSGLEALLRTRGPSLSNLRLAHDYAFSPKLSSEKKPDGRMVSKPLEDMAPFLPREEFLSNMLVPPLDED